MRSFSTKSFLLLLLLALCGQALAAPCAEMTSAEMNSADMGSHESMRAAAEPLHAADHAMHCGEETMADHCDGTSAAGDNTDCDQTCSCCPGHCATALPTADSQPATYTRGFATSGYRELNSSPEPETAIRPPIRL